MLEGAQVGKEGGAIFIDESSPQLVYLNYLPISASFGVKEFYDMHT